MNTSVECKGIEHLLEREQVIDYEVAVAKDYADIVDDLLAMQVAANPIEKCVDFDFFCPPGTRTISVPQDTIWGVLNRLNEEVQGIVMVDVERKLWWTVGGSIAMVVPTFTHSRQIAHLSRKADWSMFCNRIYAFGDGVELGAPGYVEDPVSQGLYSYAARCFNDKSIDAVDNLTIWANNLLLKYAYPVVTYTLTCVNMDTPGNDYENLFLEDGIRIIDPDLSIDVETYVKKIRRNLSDPSTVEVDCEVISKDAVSLIGKDYRWEREFY